MLKFIGFIDESGKTNDVWMTYKDKSKSEVVLAQSIKTGYTDLFNMYPDAHRKDDEALRNYFSSKTGVGERSVVAMVQTFKSLVNLADFNSEVSEEIKDHVEDAVRETHQQDKPANPGFEGNDLAITVNIQLQIPATEDASIYDKFFESLYKHVISKNKQS